MTDTRVKRLARASLAAVVALILSYIEFLIPLPIPIPGVKLGLANIVIVFLLKNDRPLSFVVLALKIALTAILFGSPVSFVFSLCGGLLSYVVMLALETLAGDKISYLGLSAIGGFCHNLGQLVATALFYGFYTVLSYITPLLTVGTFCGIICGIILILISERIVYVLAKI